MNEKEDTMTKMTPLLERNEQFALPSVISLAITLGTRTGLGQPATAHLEVGDIPPGSCQAVCDEGEDELRGGGGWRPGCHAAGLAR